MKSNFVMIPLYVAGSDEIIKTIFDVKIINQIGRGQNLEGNERTVIEHTNGISTTPLSTEELADFLGAKKYKFKDKSKTKSSNDNKVVHLGKKKVLAK